MTTRPIHAPVSKADDSDEDVLGTSSISGVMQIVPQMAIVGKATGPRSSPIAFRANPLAHRVVKNFTRALWIWRGGLRFRLRLAQSV